VQVLLEYWQEVAQSFLPCDRDQELLLPPSLREWLPDDHLAWFVIEAVEQVDLSGFYGDYRDDSWGWPRGIRLAYDGGASALCLRHRRALLAGDRAPLPRGRAFRVLCANSVPDHATIARFRAPPRGRPGGVFTEVLRLCAEAGLVSVRLLALDGTKLRANASQRATAATPRSRPRSSGCCASRGRWTRPRTSGSATPVATSCRRASLPFRAP
jgi:hypothetical protein